MHPMHDLPEELNDFDCSLYTSTSCTQGGWEGGRVRGAGRWDVTPWLSKRGTRTRKQPHGARRSTVTESDMRAATLATTRQGSLIPASSSSRPLAADPIALDHLGRGSMFAVPIDTVRTGRYVPVRQQIGTRTARYRAVLPIGAVSAPLLPEISR
ncbi:hypothetical protein BHM03_00046661 [Ensete ventricosum]|uniref:Uncharacterized protein n=1 Tax=Ensete ventricosum TaxID=4639 RepID=A0A445ML25_ENSVE|nr:hypothetical protein BHM03_00046661 [Ensete ventricosum]